MKRWIWIFCFITPMVISQWACNGDLNPNIAKPNSPVNIGSGPTTVSTPSCSTTPVSLPTMTTLSGGTTQTSFPPAASTPATVFSGSFSYSPTKGFVLRNLADWQAFYGGMTAPPPPVNFSTQMILVVAYQGCFDQVSFLSTCEDSSQVTVSVHDYQGGPHCFSITTPPATVAVTVPQSSLPVNWQVLVY